MSSYIESTIQSIRNKIFTLIGRAILTAIDNSTKTATIQVTGLKGETITGIEYFSPYGFEGMPTEGQAVIVFINGNRDQGIALNLHNRDERPTDLDDDEVEMWSKFDNYVKCNKNGEIEINGKDDYAVAFNDLKTEFNKLKDDYNAHQHSYNPGPGAAALCAVTASQNTSNIDLAKVDKVKLP